MDILEIRHLRLIRTLAETENLTRAAKRLHVSQPALSQQLRELEGRIGTSLFHRTKKKMLPTPIGQTLLGTAENVLATIAQAERDILKAVHGETGLLKIGVHCVLSYQWLPAVMQRFNRIYPKVDLALNNSHTFIRDLKSDRFDMVITGFPFEDPAIGHKKLFADEVVLISSPQHPLSAKRCVKEIDFEDTVLISLMAKSKDLLYQHYLLPAGVKIRQFMTVEQPEAIVNLVRSNLGVAIMPRWSVKSFLKNGELCAASLGPGGVRLEWRVAFLKSKKFLMFQQAFLKFLEDNPNLLPVA